MKQAPEADAAGLFSGGEYMAYTALYRKWRPDTFEAVKGQEHIVTTLKNQMKSGRIGHAYLFCGTRGTGKTTVAKIFARAVNCEHPVDGNPCNECPACRAILSGSSMNVVEIDAASNNGVDNIREIRDEVRYSPTEGKYRVYIIDEVHMLSTGAFNALLKTLEEPPSYVIFILATTEVHKIPITVLSRCQRYDFRRIGSETLFAHLKHLTEEEGIEAEDKALRYVARAADGSARDSLSLMEQCIAFHYGEKLTYEKVLDVLGAVDTQVFSRLLRCILSRDVAGAIRLLDEVTVQGRELVQFVTDFTWYLRNLLLLQTTAEGEDALEMSEESLKALREEAEQVDIDSLIRYIRICSELIGQVRYAAAKRVLIEIALIKLMKPAMEQNLESLQARVSELEARLDGGETVQHSAARPGNTGVEPGKQEPASGVPLESVAEQPAGPVVELTEAEYEDYQQLIREWDQIVAGQGRLIGSLLHGTRPSFEAGKGFCIIFRDGFACEMMQIQERLEEFSKSVSERYGHKFTFQAVLYAQGQQEPSIVRGSRLPGIEMEIQEAES